VIVSHALSHFLSGPYTVESKANEVVQLVEVVTLNINNVGIRSVLFEAAVDQP
jgi:hypothetical protein